MASKAVYTSSHTINCPSCSKSMLLKNWKDHCRQMHTMLPAVIDAKYNELKNNIERSKLSTMTSVLKSTIEKDSPVPVNTLFSMKRFALTKSTNLTVHSIEENNQLNDSQLVELEVQSQHIDSVSTDDLFMHCNIANPISSTPTVRDISSHVASTIPCFPTSSSKVVDSIQNTSDASSETSTESDDDEDTDDRSEDYVDLALTTVHDNSNDISVSSLILFKHIEGVKFITAEELNFLNTQRKNFPNIRWFTEHKEKENVKPSRNWFSKDHVWLRAVYSGNRYGLLCADCVQFAKNDTLIDRSNGAFVVRPFWKLKHKGLQAIKQHHNSDLHRESRSRRIAADIVINNGNIVGQLRCVNMETQTKKYLSVLLQTLWFIVKEEIAVMKFKSFVELLNKVECPSVIKWLKLSNMKQRYWSHEATTEWLLSINNYINHQQISSLKKTEFLNLIIDETTDISVKQMVCICLRYVEKDSGCIKEEIFKLASIHNQSGEGIFSVVEQFIDDLQKQVGKEFIITAQTYDGAAAMRYQAQGHVRSRLSAWAIYIYCHSHLLNLSIKDAVEYSFYDAYDTIKSALSFLRDSPHRIEILFNSQKATGSSKKGHTTPKSSTTRWSYSYEIVRFACEHYLAIILSLSTISQSKTNGSSDARRYAIDLMKPVVVFQIHILRDVLRPAMKFLRQIEKRGLCLDQFVLNVNAARETISHAMINFDFVNVREIMNNVRTFAPVINSTAHSTRSEQQKATTDLDESELVNMGNSFVQYVLEALDDRFDTEAKGIIDNLCIFSSPSNQKPEDLLNNPLIKKYTSSISYKHKGVDGKIYERTDQPLLIFKHLQDDVYAFSEIVDGTTTIPAILVKLAKFGSIQCGEWFRFYQILGTFAIGSNEAERIFSTLRRTKTWLRNSLSDSTVEILSKLSSLDIQLSNDAIDFIVEDFVKNPGRAKSRNISLYLENHQVKKNDDDDDYF